MYSILSKEGKQGQIIHFLADSDDDLVLIIDTCAPGSTVEVLSVEKEEGVNGIHKFIKAPNGRWTLYEGETEFKVPVNDAQVSVPAATAKFGNQTADAFQDKVTIYPTGLVTGELKQAECPELYGEGDQKSGHFFCATLDTPKKARQYGITFDGEEETSKDHAADGWLMVRYENMKDKDKKTVKVAYDSGESFTFDLSHMDLK